jgi:hypothetical protein
MTKLIVAFGTFSNVPKNQLYGTQSLRPRHCSLSWARWIQSAIINLMASVCSDLFLVLQSHIHLDISSDLFPSGFIIEISYEIPFRSNHATYSANLIPFIG